MQKLRWWSMAVMPFLVFYLVGMVLEAGAPYALKALLLAALLGAAHAAATLLLGDELRNLLPLSVYLATKVRAARARRGRGSCTAGYMQGCTRRCGSTSRGRCSWRARCRGRRRWASC